jgi:uncharacterized protein YbcV (DUF1398 family)
MSKDAIVLSVALTVFVLPLLWVLTAVATRMTEVNEKKFLSELKKNTIVLLVLYVITIVCVILSDKGIIS